MKDKPINRAQCFIILMSILLVASFVAFIVVPHDCHEANEEAKPADAAEKAPEAPHTTGFPVAFLPRMSPELEKKIFAEGPEYASTAWPVSLRHLPNGEFIEILKNGKMLYDGRLLTENGADLLDAYLQGYKEATTSSWRYGFQRMPYK